MSFFFRITYNNIGIYEALKNNIPFNIWKSLLKSKIFIWLPKPPEYLNGYYSYFTELGFEKFKQLVLPICKKYLNKENIKIEKLENISDKIVYQDDYQIVVEKTHKIFESKFEKLYLKIINEYTGNNYSNLTNELKEICPIQHEYLDRYKIINETVKSKKLTPIPDELISNICDNIIKINQSTYKISYQKICELIKKSEYIEADIFRKNLLKYAKNINGNLFILFINIDNSDNILNNITFNTLKNVIQSDEKCCDFYNEILKYSDKIKGLTIIKHYFELEEYKDSLIFVNKEQISDYFQFDDILDHELTHFIQRITGFAEDITNIVTRDYSKGLSKTELQIINKFCDTEEQKLLIKQIIFDKFRKEEIIETQKDIINLFKKLYILKGKNENKLIWLNNFLQSINNYSIFEKQNLFQKLKAYLDSDKRNETFEITFTLICICYLILKNEYHEYNIDETLKEEFKTEL